MAFRNVYFAYRQVIRARRRVFGPLRPSWSLDFETVAELSRTAARQAHWVPVAVPRKITDSMLARSNPVSLVRETQAEWVDARGVPARWFRPQILKNKAILLYLHGGGYAFCSSDTHRLLISRICKEVGCAALAVEYRLAPEYRFPAQLEDVLDVYQYLLKQGVDPKQIVIAGDSAGGGLTLSTLLALRERGWEQPAAAIGLSPWADLEATGASMVSNDRTDYIHRRVIRSFGKQFVRHQEELRHPLAAPIYGNYQDVAPLLLQTGGAEVLLDDAVRVAERARAAGVSVELDIVPDMVHVWHMFDRLTPESEKSIQRIGEFIHRHVA
jgi:epsilon-lactone hydrolase